MLSSSAHSKCLITTLIAVIIIIAAGIGGYVFVQYQKIKNENTYPPVQNPHANIPQAPAPIPAPATVTVPADWKTYRSEKYGFEVSYPENFRVDVFSQLVVIYEKEKLQVLPNSPIDPYSNGLTLSIYERGRSCGDCTAFQLKETTVDNYYAVKAITDNSLTTFIWIYNPAKDHVLRMNYGYPANKKSIQSDQLLQQILSTFKFIKL